MNCLDVSLQIFWMSEGFPTRITFVISCFFMNTFDVLTQDLISGKNFPTNFAIMVFDFVIGIHMNH